MRDPDAVRRDAEARLTAWLRLAVIRLWEPHAVRYVMGLVRRYAATYPAPVPHPCA